MKRYKTEFMPEGDRHPACHRLASNLDLGRLISECGHLDQCQGPAPCLLVFQLALG